MRFSLSVSHSCLVICKSAKPAKKWYEMHMCISWLCPCKFKVVNSAFKTHASLIHLNKFASCYQTKSFIEDSYKVFNQNMQDILLVWFCFIWLPCFLQHYQRSIEILCLSKRMNKKSQIPFNYKWTKVFILFMPCSICVRARSYPLQRHENLAYLWKCFITLVTIFIFSLVNCISRVSFYQQWDFKGQLTKIIDDKVTHLIQL